MNFVKTAFNRAKPFLAVTVITISLAGTASISHATGGAVVKAAGEYLLPSIFEVSSKRLSKGLYDGISSSTIGKQLKTSSNSLMSLRKAINYKKPLKSGQNISSLAVAIGKHLITNKKSFGNTSNDTLTALSHVIKLSKKKAKDLTKEELNQLTNGIIHLDSVVNKKLMVKTKCVDESASKAGFRNSITSIPSLKGLSELESILGSRSSQLDLNNFLTRKIKNIEFKGKDLKGFDSNFKEAFKKGIADADQVRNLSKNNKKKLAIFLHVLESGNPKQQQMCKEVLDLSAIRVDGKISKINLFDTKADNGFWKIVSQIKFESKGDATETYTLFAKFFDDMEKTMFPKGSDTPTMSASEAYAITLKKYAAGDESLEEMAERMSKRCSLKNG